MFSKNILSLEIKAEELYPACGYCNSILFDNYFDTDPTLDEWFSEDRNQCFGKEVSEYPDWPIGHRFSNQSRNLSQDEIHYMNAGSQPLGGLS